MKSTVAETKTKKATAKKTVAAKKSDAKTSVVKKTTVKKSVEKAVEKAPVVKTVTPSVVKTASSKNSLIIAAALLVIAVLGYVGYRFYPIAIVNGQVISRVAYYKAMEAQIGKQAIENLVTETLIQQAADKAGFKVDQQAIDDQMKQIEEQVTKQGQTLDAALAAEGITKTDLVHQIELQKIVETLGQGQIAITDKDIATYIEKNKSALPSTTPAELNALAKTELEKEAKSNNISTWLESLKTNATVIYR